MKVILIANKYLTKKAAKISKEEAAEKLGVSLTDDPKDVRKIFEDKLNLLESGQEDRTDEIIDLEAAFRVLMNITDSNLDNFGRKLQDEEPVSEEKFDELDKQLGEFSDNIWGMDLDEVEKKYQSLDDDVKKVMKE